MLIHLSWYGGAASSRRTSSADAAPGTTWVFNVTATCGIQLQVITSTSMVHWRALMEVLCADVSWSLCSWHGFWFSPSGLHDLGTFCHQVGEQPMGPPRYLSEGCALILGRDCHLLKDATASTVWFWIQSYNINYLSYWGRWQVWVQSPGTPFFSLFISCLLSKELSQILCLDSGLCMPWQVSQTICLTLACDELVCMVTPACSWFTFASRARRSSGSWVACCWKLTHWLSCKAWSRRACSPGLKLVST